MRETWVRSLDQEDPLEKEMATYYFCLENPTDGGAWRATVHGVAKSRTRLSDFTFAFTFRQLLKKGIVDTLRPKTLESQLVSRISSLKGPTLRSLPELQ